jgi:Flp pilus assembly protein TadG
MILRSRHAGLLRKRRGALAVEFTIVSFIFMGLLLGMIELSRALMVRHLLTNAAREGCRTGVIEGKGLSDVTAAVNAKLSAEGITSDSVTVTVDDGSGGMANTMAGDEITVSVSVPVTSVSWLPGLQYLSGNLTSQYTLRRE